MPPPVRAGIAVMDWVKALLNFEVDPCIVCSWTFVGLFFLYAFFREEKKK